MNFTPETPLVFEYYNDGLINNIAMPSIFLLPGKWFHHLNVTLAWHGHLTFKILFLKKKIVPFVH